LEGRDGADLAAVPASSSLPEGLRSRKLILIGVVLALIGLGIGGFLWSLKNGETGVRHRLVGLASVKSDLCQLRKI
jgi:hypothetical protein